MKNSLRLLVLSGMLGLVASPVFASETGPGSGGNPFPPGGTSNGTMTTVGTSSTMSIVGEIIAVLGAVGF